MEFLRAVFLAMLVAASVKGSVAVKHSKYRRLEKTVWHMQKQISKVVDKQTANTAHLEHLASKFENLVVAKSQPSGATGGRGDALTRFSNGEVKLATLGVQLTDLKKSLDELVQGKEREVFLTEDLNMLRAELDSLRSDVQKVKSARAHDEDQGTSGRQHISNEVKNHATTIKWLQTSVGEIRSEVGELARSHNVSARLQRRQQVDSTLELLHVDVGGLRKDLVHLNVAQKQVAATVEQMRSEVQDATSQHLNATRLATELWEEVDDIKQQLSTSRVSASKAASSQPAHDHHGDTTHLRHKGRLRGEVATLKGTVGELEAKQGSLEVQVETLKRQQKTSSVKVREVRAEVQGLLKNNDGYYDRHRTMGSTIDDLKLRLTEVAEQSIRQENRLEKLGADVSGVTKLHDSTKQLFLGLEELEEKAGEQEKEVKKEMARFEFNMAQMTSSLKDLREDQTDYVESVRTLRSQVSGVQLRSDSNHLRTLSIQAHLANQTLGQCRSDGQQLKKEYQMEAEEEISNKVESVVTSDLDQVTSNETTTLPKLLGQVKQLQHYVSVMAAPLPEDCSQLSSGQHLIHPTGLPGPVVTDCDTSGSGDGWTVLQRRTNGVEDFYRNWEEYKNGFGDPVGEFWIGNLALHHLTHQRPYLLHIDLWDNMDRYWVAEYSNFTVEGESDHFRLRIGDFSRGNISDSLSYHNGAPFSTRDADHDASSTSCADSYRGGWWYHLCQHVNINGQYSRGLEWLDEGHQRWVQVVRSVMRVRPLVEGGGR